MRQQPLTPTQAANLADTLRALADELTAPHAPQTQNLLKQALATGYPTRTSTTPTNQNNQTDDNGHPTNPDTPTERAALNPDKAATWATDLLTSLHELNIDTTTALSALKGWSPRRHIPTCPQCDTPTTPDHNCPDKTWPDCKGCGNPMAPGDRHGGRHDRCRQFRQYHGYDKVSAARLRLGDDLITDDGVYHG